MQNTRSFKLLFLLLSVAMALPSAVAQVVIARVPAGVGPADSAVNSITNKIYVTNQFSGTVTVIDGFTNGATSVNVGSSPIGVAVNNVTNKIYVANRCGDDPSCASAGTVTVIDGATNTTTTVTVGDVPRALAVNSATNKIYVANYCDNPQCNSSPGTTITVIDGYTNETATVNAGYYPDAVAVNSASNKIYVANQCGTDPICQSSTGTVTVIDGATNTTTNVDVGVYPTGVAVNSVTNKIYVQNQCGDDLYCGSNGTVTVIDGASNKTTEVAVGPHPLAIAVNPVANKVYVVNCNGPGCQGVGTVTVIDGVTNNTTAVTVGVYPYSVAVDSVANKVYVPNYCGNNMYSCGGSPGTVTVIDGAALSTTTVAVGYFPKAAAVNSATDRIYVPSSWDNTVWVIGWPGVARFNAVLGAPKCDLLFMLCDSGPSLLLGRDNMTGGAEPNQPNTIHNSCADGTSGTFHVDESMDRLKVATTNGVTLARGAIVRASATVWVADPTQDAVDLYYATNANNPTWTYIATLVPRAPGSQTLSALFRLGIGQLQAVRANFRKGGTKSSCSTGDYDDHDDLTFAVR